MSKRKGPEDHDEEDLGMFEGKNVPTTPRHVLIAWLCMWRLQHGSENEGHIDMPGAVKEGLLHLGWIEEAGDGHNITDEGRTVSDLEGPHWGIDTLG